MIEFHLPSLVAILVVTAVVSVALAPRVRTADGFYRGWSEGGQAPGVWTLTFSQVTTWIFARSLLNAGILGYFFGIAGALAYTVYYGSFLTGWLIVDQLRFRRGYPNIQTFFAQRFGRLGVSAYNILISLRLLTEVFANLLVVGIVFSAAGVLAENLAIMAVAVITLFYSMTGGLRASLRTDVLQMTLLAVLLVILFGVMLMHPLFEVTALVSSSTDLTGPGWVLMAVAFLQVLSYPLHDPVMMDRGFVSDRDTTRRSFIHAFWISALLILMFGLMGVFAGLHREEGNDLLFTLQQLLGAPAMLLLAAALVLSAASTMDSVFSSVSKLTVVDMGVGGGTLHSGRWAMIGFAIAGLALVYWGTDDLYAAVAVSGTASLFLTPIILISIFANRQVARWSFVVNFVVAIGAAAFYFLENAGYVNVMGPLTGLEHTYSHLLVVTLIVLTIGMGAFLLGMGPRADD